MKRNNGGIDISGMCGREDIDYTTCTVYYMWCSTGTISHSRLGIEKKYSRSLPKIYDDAKVVTTFVINIGIDYLPKAPWNSLRIWPGEDLWPKIWPETMKPRSGRRLVGNLKAGTRISCLPAVYIRLKRGDEWHSERSIREAPLTSVGGPP
jgi:hypothetical protein